MIAYEYFSPETDPIVFTCSETGEVAPLEYQAFMLHVDKLRGRCGFPFIATSGYRSPRHSIEAKKEKAGQHTRGAIDIKIESSARRYILLKQAVMMGFTGIGIGKDFIHLDRRTSRPMTWTYY